MNLWFSTTDMLNCDLYEQKCTYNQNGFFFKEGGGWA